MACGLYSTLLYLNKLSISCPWHMHNTNKKLWFLYDVNEIKFEDLLNNAGHMKIIGLLYCSCSVRSTKYNMGFTIKLLTLHNCKIN